MVKSKPDMEDRGKSLRLCMMSVEGDWHMVCEDMRLCFLGSGLMIVQVHYKDI